MLMALPALGKALGLAKALGAKGLAAGAYGTKMAGPALTKAGQFLMPSGGKGELVGRLAPEAFFTAVNQLQMPDEANLFDRGLSALTTFGGSGLAGLAASKAASKVPGLNKIPGMEMGVDFAGSMLGDMAGHNIAMSGSAIMDKALGGEGLNYYDRMGRDQQSAYRDQIQRETLAALGYLPGTRHDDFLEDTGLA